MYNQQGWMQPSPRGGIDIVEPQAYKKMNELSRTGGEMGTKLSLLPLLPLPVPALTA